MATSSIEFSTPRLFPQTTTAGSDSSLARKTEASAGSCALRLEQNTLVQVDVASEDCIRCIMAAPVFAGLSSLEYQAIASRAEERWYSSGDTIFLQDDPVRHVFVVAKGRVKITQVSEEGKETLLRLEDSGSLVDDVIGSSHLHPLTARAMESCSILAWDASMFEDLSHRNNTIHRNAAAIMRARLRDLQQRFCDVATLRVPQRLARVIVQLAGENSESLRSIVLSREELAQMTGTSLFTVSRVLSSWATCNVVTLDRKEIVIEDLRRLLRLADAA